MPEFKFIDRGKEKTAVLVHGWAADHRIFSTVDLEFNYLLPVGLYPPSFTYDLLEALEKYGLGKISVIAWSMGCFLACDFLSANSGVVDEAVFIAARRKYPENAIKEIKGLLERNRTAFLYKFYSDCFSGAEKGEFLRFKRSLLKAYLDQMDTDSLIGGLQYISQNQIAPEALNGMKLKFIHGTEDKIAPFGEARELKDQFSREVGFVSVKAAGHMPFLRPDFSGIFYGGCDA